MITCTKGKAVHRSDQNLYSVYGPDTRSAVLTEVNHVLPVSRKFHGNHSTTSPPPRVISAYRQTDKLTQSQSSCWMLLLLFLLFVCADIFVDWND